VHHESPSTNFNHPRTPSPTTSTTIHHQQGNNIIIILPPSTYPILSKLSPQKFPFFLSQQRTHHHCHPTSLSQNPKIKIKLHICYTTKKSSPLSSFSIFSKPRNQNQTSCKTQKSSSSSPSFIFSKLKLKSTLMQNP
jgi:hypothetical protein